MTWALKRYRLGENVTDGLLLIPNHELAIPILERPWLPGVRGGVPFKSCVPDGEYSLTRWTRPNGDVVLALRNPDLGVYHGQGQVPDDGGRYAILIHPANWISDIVGCLAPGQIRTIDDGGKPMVTNSRKAMQFIMDAFNEQNPEGEPTVDATLNIYTAIEARNG